MTDTVPLCVFSLFNGEGALELRWFALTSLLAGISRGLAVFIVFEALGIRLV